MSRTPSPSTDNEPEPAGFSRFLFSRQSGSRKGSADSTRSERAASPVVESPRLSKGRRLAGFASRSLRKSQWRLFKHKTFFGSTKRNNPNNQLQLPRLTLRHPSVDGSAMPLAIDGEPLTLNARRWTESEGGRLRDSRDSSGFDGSVDRLDDVTQPMTAPVSPSVPLSASSSQSDGWKYSSQKILWKLKPRYIGGFSHNSSTSSSTDSAWKSLDSSTWRHSLDDKEVVLRGTQLESLSEVEKAALQILAQQRIAKLLPGVNINKTKDPLAALRQKRQKLLKSSRTLTVGDVSRRPSGSSTDDERRVFGVSLVDCLHNEKRLDMESRCRSLDDSAAYLSNSNRGAAGGSKSVVRSEPEFIHSFDDSRKWLYPSTQNLYPSCCSHPTSPSPLVGSAPPTCSLPIKEVSNSAHLLSDITQGRFVKKSRASCASLSYSIDAADDVTSHPLRVPRIVENCTQYLMAYGLNVVGLFRIAGSSKRTRQLRSALEKVGGGVAIGDDLVESITAHDVATILKEYFRDLPQSLLSKQHYQAYIAAAKLSSEDRIECCRLLVSLLPTPSVDTVFVLLRFLNEVASNSPFDDNGEVPRGNRMDARNLATIFAPCILRPDHDKLHLSLAENDAQVTVMETMISHVVEIFRIPKELQCQMYNKLREMEPSRLDRVLDQLARGEGYEAPLSSPFPATVEEESKDRNTPMERHPNGKVRVCSQRSGSWPFSLRSAGRQRFFPNEEAGTSEGTPNESEAQSTPPVAETLTTNSPATASARSPSLDRDFLRSAARSGAAAARRRLRNVVRAFRFSSVARSTPDMARL